MIIVWAVPHTCVETMLKFEVVLHFANFWRKHLHIVEEALSFDLAGHMWKSVEKWLQKWAKCETTSNFNTASTLVCSRTEIFGTLTEWVCLLWPDNIVRYTDSPLTILRHSLGGLLGSGGVSLAVEGLLGRGFLGSRGSPWWGVLCKAWWDTTPLWTEWQTGAKILPCPKLRLRAVITPLLLFNFFMYFNSVHFIILWRQRRISEFCKNGATKHQNGRFCGGYMRKIRLDSDHPCG